MFHLCSHTVSVSFQHWNSRDDFHPCFFFLTAFWGRNKSCLIKSWEKCSSFTALESFYCCWDQRSSRSQMQTVEVPFCLFIVRHKRTACFDLSIIHLNGTLLLKLNSRCVKQCLQCFHALMSHVVEMIFRPCAEEYVGTGSFLCPTNSNCLMPSCGDCWAVRSAWPISYAGLVLPQVLELLLLSEYAAQQLWHYI